MQYTENYKFLLPDGTDKVNIENINKNFSDIDGYLAENTARLDELEQNGGVGGGVTPALYVRTASSETVEGITWHIEKWNDGYARCWGDYVAEELNFSITGATGLNIALVLFSLPTDLFTDTPEFASVLLNTNSEGVCNTNVISLEKEGIAFNVHRTDNAPTNSMQNVHFYIEVRGDCSHG